MVKRPRKPPSKPLLNEDDASLRGGRRRPRDPAQPALPFDPMPARIVPCLAELMPKAPSGVRWSYEVKWDGYRIAVHRERDKVRIITRGGYDWTTRFPVIADAARDLAAETAVIDGEAVVLDAVGKSDYNALVADLGGPSSKKASHRSIMMAFDLLYVDGRDLTSNAQGDRRKLLFDLVPPSATGAIQLS
ncbi:hypothetical protein [Rhizobium giardinii]|uniref:ATP-dependent DNA ligase n=1 Tax=Rhizobium giardinii TaxID=56731 RepID=UPI003D6F3FFD